METSNLIEEAPKLNTSSDAALFIENPITQPNILDIDDVIVSKEVQEISNVE